MVDDGLVHAGAHHLLKVVHWHQVFDQARERPESLFFCHYLKQPGNDEVEALAVSHVDVAHAVGGAYALDRIEHLLAQLLAQGITSLPVLFVRLEQVLVWESTAHIDVDLVAIKSGKVRVEV